MTTTTGPRTASAVSAGRLPLVAVCLGYFLVILDVTVVTVALPTIGADLRGAVTSLQWVADGYTLAFAGLLLFCGGLGDRFGPRAVFLAGLAVFTLASAGCGAAPGAGALVAARLAQGVGAALMVPASLALLRHAYPDAAARARAFGVWGMVAGVAAAAGPVVGGALVSAVGWRAVFAVDVPFGIAGVVLTRRYVPAPARSAARTGLDVPAQAAGAVGLAALTSALIEAGARGWTDPAVLALLAGGALALAAFVLVERRARAPMLPLALFRDRRFGAAAVVGVLLNLGFYGLLFAVPLYFQRVARLDPLEVGLAMAPMALMPVVASPLGGRLAARGGPHVPMTVGLLVGAVGLVGWLVAGPGTSYWVLVAPLVLTGFGTGFTMPAATAAIMEAAPADRGGVASAVLNAARQTGSALGVGLVGSFLAAGTVAGLHAGVLVGGTGFAAAAVATVATLRPRPA